MSQTSGPAVVNERRRADRVQDAVGIHITRLQDKPAAGDAPAAQSASSRIDAPSHKCSISSVGLAFAHETLMQPGELITVEITLFPSKRTVTADARVVSANNAPEIADGDKPTYRIAFESIGDEDRDFIEAHVQKIKSSLPSEF